MKTITCIEHLFDLVYNKRMTMFHEHGKVLRVWKIFKNVEKFHKCRKFCYCAKAP